MRTFGLNYPLLFPEMENTESFKAPFFLLYAPSPHFPYLHSLSKEDPSYPSHLL